MPSLSEQQQKFALDVASLIQEINRQGFSCSLGEAWRTPEMAAIYAKQGKGIMRSQHLVRLAIDLNLFKDGVSLPDSQAHKPFGDYWQSLDPLNRWGGDWDNDEIVDPDDNDGNHYERRLA